MNLHEIGEFGLIARWQQKLKQRGGVTLGIGDDAAILETLKTPLVTCDALVEKVHFRLAWSTPRQLGKKSIAVNVSDIAAMGGQPVAAFAMLALPNSTELAWLDELYVGMESAAEEYSLTIAGGDVTRSLSDLMIGVTVVGETQTPITRAGAIPGDVLIVTGTLGDAAAGLELLQNPALKVSSSTREYLLRRHFEPTARLREMTAALTAADAVSAALDLSDGLAGDAAHIAACSDVTLEIETALLPISEECREAAQAAHTDANKWALHGGEDYELLLCVRPERADGVLRALQSTGVAATIVGRCVEKMDAAVVLINESGRRIIAPPAFRHF